MLAFLEATTSARNALKIHFVSLDPRQRPPARMDIQLPRDQPRRRTVFVMLAILEATTFARHVPKIHFGPLDLWQLVRIVPLEVIVPRLF
jgi:hypothetical protein